MHCFLWMLGAWKEVDYTILNFKKRHFSIDVGYILTLCFVKSFFLDVHVIIKFLFQNINFFKGFCLWLELNLMWTWFQPLMTLGGLLSRYSFGVSIFTPWNSKNIKRWRGMVDTKRVLLYFVFWTWIPIVASKLHFVMWICKSR